MRSVSVLSTVVVLILLSFYPSYSLADGTEISSISLLPEYENVEIGEIFSVEVYADLKENISGWEIEKLSFPPHILEIVNITEGDVFSEYSDVTFVEGSVDNSKGELTGMFCFTLHGEKSKISGTLCTISFKAKRAGIAYLNLSAELACEGYSVPAIIHNCTVNVSGNITDHIKPEISNIVIIPSIQYVGQNVNISCRVTDNVAVDGVYINISLPNGSTMNVSASRKGYDIYYVNLSYPEIGTYHFFIWAIDTSGNGNMSDAHEFEIIPFYPTADFYYEPLNPSAGYTVYFYSTSYDIDGYIVNWTWYFGDGDIAYGENVTHPYAQNGTYEVRLYVRDNDGFTSSIAKNITVGNPNPPFSVSIVRPVNGLYILGRYIRLKLKTAIIVGRINVVARIHGTVDIKTVKFYIDNNLKYVAEKEPYIWVCRDRLIGRHNIKVVAEDVYGREESDNISAFFLILGRSKST